MRGPRRSRTGPAALLALLVTPLTAAADAPGARRLRVTPHVGVAVGSEYHEGLVLFPDGDRDFLRLDPGTGLLIGVHGAYYVTGALAGYLGLSLVSADAEYIEGDNPRPDVDVTTAEIDLGLLYDVVTFGAANKASALGVGGGLSIVDHSFDTFYWNDRPVETGGTSVGLHALGALDVGLSELIALRVQLELGVLPLQQGDLENDIAIADEESDAIVDGETMTYAELSLGVTFRL